MIHLKILFTSLFIFCLSVGFCQDTLTFDSPVFVSGKKIKQLHKFSEVEIIYYINNNSKDSIKYTVTAFSTNLRSDTLIVSPDRVEEYKFTHKSAPYDITSSYPYNSDIIIKIPLNKIDRISGERSGVKMVSGCFIFISTLGIISAGPIAALSRAKNKEQLFYQIGGTSLLTFAASLTINLRPGKKIFHLDPNRTTKRIWTLTLK